MAAEYRVNLDNFHGPLDLLLHLIKRDELDIYDIPIARITESYLAYLNLLRDLDGHGFDINVAGEFLVMAATLMEIKSATLLPRQPDAATGNDSASADLTDPRLELVQKLLEFKRFKDSAAALERRATVHENRFPRIPAQLDSDEPPPLDLEEVQVWDLLSAFDRMLRELGARRLQHEVTYDDTPIDLHAADIEDRVRHGMIVSLFELIVGRKSKSEMIGVFLAVLELVRQKRVLVRESDDGRDILINDAPADHKKTYNAASQSADAPAEPAADAATP